MNKQMMKNPAKRLIVGISGASGLQYGVRLLEILADTDIETHLIISKAAHRVRVVETKLSASALQNLADVVYPFDDIACAVSSGSYVTLGMIIAPCSMHTLAEIASGVTSNALTRAADVTLKERRPLVLMVRESPLHQGHLQNMLSVTQMGAIIAPPVPAFYNQPDSIDTLINHSVGRILDLFHLDIAEKFVKRWQGISKI